MPASSEAQAKAAPEALAGAPAVPAPSAWAAALGNSAERLCMLAAHPTVNPSQSNTLLRFRFRGFHPHGGAFSARPIPNGSGNPIRNQPQKLQANCLARTSLRRPGEKLFYVTHELPAQRKTSGNNCSAGSGIHTAETLPQDDDPKRPRRQTGCHEPHFGTTAPAVWTTKTVQERSPEYFSGRWERSYVTQYCVPIAATCASDKAHRVCAERDFAMPGHENEHAHRLRLERPLSFVDGLAQHSTKTTGGEPADASREHQAEAAAPTADGSLNVRPQSLRSEPRVRFLT